MKQNLNRASRVRFRFYWPFHLLPTVGTMLLFAIAILAAWPAAGSAAEPEVCPEQGVPAGPASAATSGAPSAATEDVKVYVDPDTGELLPGPPVGEPESPDSVSTAPAEPEYETETLPDGTVVLDLSKRPPEELRAEVVDGKTVFCHRPGPAPPLPSED